MQSDMNGMEKFPVDALDEIISDPRWFGAQVYLDAQSEKRRRATLEPHDPILLAQPESRRDAIADELDRAIDATLHVGCLKQSSWYQDRKAEIRSIDVRIAGMAPKYVSARAMARAEMRMEAK